MTNRVSETNTGRPVSPMQKILSFALAAIIFIALGAFGWNRYQDMNAANAEADIQKQETEVCRKRLTAIYTAWTHYSADHNGRDPGSYEDLVPKYIPDPKMLICPTSERWIAKGAHMQCGNLKFNGKSYPVSYGFRCFTASYPIELRQFGSKTIIIACDAHQEGMYRSVYHRTPPLSAFDAAQRVSLNDAVRNTKVLALHKDGTIDLEAAE